MSRKWFVALAVLCVLATPIGGLLYHADNPVGMVLLFGGMLALPVVVGLLTKRFGLAVVAFAVSVVGMVVGIQFAAPTWMAFAGEVLPSCEVVGKRTVQQRTAPSYEVSEVDCGGRALDYRPLVSSSEPIGKVGARTSLVADRTGVLPPVRPSDVTAVAPWAVGGTTLLGLLFIAYAATRPLVPPKRVEQDFL